MTLTLTTPIIYLARHATPDWSRTDLPYHLLPGPPLVPQGEAEAAELGRFLREAGVSRLYTSPLERARRTAENSNSGDRFNSRHRQAIRKQRNIIPFG